MFAIWTLDGETLLASPEVSDKILAILTRLRDRYGAVRLILGKVAALEGAERELAFRQLTILAGLRQLGKYVDQEAKTMPVLTDIMEHDLLGPAIRQGMEEGFQRGRREEALELLESLMTKRFGSVPVDVTVRLAKCSEGELRGLVMRTLDVKSIEDLFQ